MTRSIKLAVAAAMALGTTSAFATNGDSLIGLGAKSRAMAGIGIGMSHGAESGLSNPALIHSNEITFGGTIFMPDVKMKNEIQGMPNPTSYADSDSDLSVIPEVALSVKVNDSFTWGVGMYGVAGMGVDYRDDVAVYGNPPSPSGPQNAYMGTMSGTNQMLTNLQLMRFAVPLAYHVSGFSVAVSPILQYGSLSIAYNNGSYFMAPDGKGGAVPVNVLTSNGVSQDFGFGYNIGLSYEMAGLTIGAVYTSAIDMEYKNQISSASKNFGMKQGKGLSDHLEQPAELGLGVSYKLGGSTFAIDYKQIKWSSAKGYEDFEWEDQNVIMLGYEYATKGWAVRVGYNYASNPIKEQSAASMMTPGEYDGAVINYFNAAGFPAITESHYAIGGSYIISETFGVDFAYTYSPEISESYDTSALTQAMAAGKGDPNARNYKSKAKVKHSQQGITVAMTIKF